MCCTNVCQQEVRLNLELHAALTQEALEAINRQRKSHIRLFFSKIFWKLELRKKASRRETGHQGKKFKNTAVVKERECWAVTA